MLFSVLIANYNNGKHFFDCFESLIQQNYENWEAIIVDDCSTDDSINIIQEIIKQDRRFRLYRNKKNRGCGFTKNRCIKFAQGEICGFLDPDDTLKPNAIDVMVNSFNKHSDASIISSKYNFVDKNHNYLEPGLIGGNIPKNQSFLTSSQGEITHFAAFRRKCIMNAGGINKKFKRAVDQDLYFNLEEHGNHYFIDQPLYNYRQHSNGISQNENFHKSLYWSIKAKKSAYRRRKKNSSGVKNLTRLEINQMQYDYLYSKLNNGNGHRNYYSRCYLFLKILIVDKRINNVVKVQIILRTVYQQIKKIQKKFSVTPLSRLILSFINKLRIRRIVKYVKIKSALETISEIKRTIIKKKPGAYMRFGDGDIFLMEGKDDMLHSASVVLSNEMRECFELKGPTIHKGLPIHSDIFGFEEGMRLGVHKVRDKDAVNFALSVQKLLRLDQLYTSVALHHLAVCNKSEFYQFLGFLREKTDVFVGNESVSDRLINVLFDCKRITTPSENSYNQIDRIERELCGFLDKRKDVFSLAVIAMGCPGRVLQKRIVKKGYNVYLFDFGSLLDAFNGDNTRDWIELTGGIDYYQELLVEFEETL